MKGKGWSKGGGAEGEGMREEKSWGRREEDAGRRRPGGTSLQGGRRRNNGTLPARSPGPSGARGQRGGRGAAGRYGARLFPGNRSRRLRGGPRLHLLSPTTALRPMGAIALRESLGSEPPHATPADTAASQGRRALLAAARRPAAALGID